MKLLLLRHRSAPAALGCRWCGFLKTDHANRYLPGRGLHDYEAPTTAQFQERLKMGAGRTYPAPLRAPAIQTGTANYARVRR